MGYVSFREGVYWENEVHVLLWHGPKWLSEIRIWLIQEAKHKPWMMQSTDTHDMKPRDIQWNFCCSHFVTYCYCICSQHGTTQSCIYLTIANAFQSDRLLLKKEELDDDNSGEISFEEFAPQEAPFLIWTIVDQQRKSKANLGYPWEGTLAVSCYPNITPYCLLKPLPITYL